METHYYKEYSPSLGREWEWKTYGHAGRPVIYIPCQDGRFYDFENYHMAGTLAPLIEDGRLMVCSVDTIDKETWSDKSGDPRGRIERYEGWFRFLTEEIAPRLRYEAACRNGYDQGLMAFGASLGATHAANLFFRRPDQFERLLALSGIYTASYGFDGYTDDLVYLNSPVDSLGGMDPGHPYIPLYNRAKAVICVGQGPWEIPDATRDLDRVCAQKGIHLTFDYWGYDVRHDWDWWYKQTLHFMPWLLDLC